MNKIQFRHKQEHTNGYKNKEVSILLPRRSLSKETHDCQQKKIQGVVKNLGAYVPVVYNLDLTKNYKTTLRNIKYAQMLGCLCHLFHLATKKAHTVLCVCWGGEGLSFKIENINNK